MSQENAVVESLAELLGAPTSPQKKAAKVVAEPGLTPEQQRIRESREVLKHPLPSGMAFFEAPDGFIIMAEADQPDVLYRQGNNGKGMRINPMR